MGIDWIEIRFNIEKRFGIRITHEDFRHLEAIGRADLTAGELHDIICTKLRSLGHPVPISSWNSLRLELAHALGISPFSIRRSSWLTADLGMG